MKIGKCGDVFRLVMKLPNDIWTSTESDAVRLCSFERETSRKILGPVQGIGEGTVRYNQELYQLYRLPDIIRTIGVTGLQWADLLKKRVAMMCLEELCISELKEKFSGGTNTSLDI